uniref:DUF4592 domain-containing protein n=1 Tax=Periophthalmus magnuspinnatus TaxID=409849 RepID=A0A3B3ZN20_9GOBI
KKFFKRKKRKESGALKNSASNEDLNKPPEQSEAGLGNRSQSHDSVFAADWSEAHEALGASQDSLHGKVKSLQMQLKQSLLCGKRTHDTGAVSEDDGLPCSPPDYTPSKVLQILLLLRDSSISLDSGELSCPGSSRAMSPLVATPGDFSSPASASVCLDNSAARHKLELRQRGKRRKKRPLVSEIETKDIQEIKHGVALPLSQSDSEEEEEERRKDLNLIKQQETEENQEDLNAILDQIEQEVIESEEEVTDTAILDQVDKESNDVKETNAEMDKHIETEVELETQNSARFVEIVSEDVLEFDGEILQGKIASTEIADDQNHLEETEIPIIESEQVNIKQNDEKEAEMIDKYETEESENKEATISKIAVSKTTSLEINLVSPNSKKEFSFPNLEHFKGEAKEEICDKTEKSTVSTVEIMDTQYQEDLNQFEADVEILDKIDKTKEDEIIKGSIGENEMIEELENPEKIKEDVENFDNFDQMEEESTNLSMSKMEEIQELGQIEHKTEISQKIHEDADIFYKIDKMQKEKRVQFCMEEMEERDEQEKNEQKVKNSKNEESNWPKFTIATAWQRSLSTAEKEELGSPTHPEPGNQKDPTRPDPGSKVQESRSSPWSKQVQESRLETGSKPVQESRRESESPPVQLSKSEPKTQQDPESRPDPRSEQVQEARTESKTQQEPESRPDPGFKFQMSRPSPWSKQVQESRPNPGSEQIQKSKSDPKTQQDPESTEPDSKLQESRPGSWVKQCSPQKHPGSCVLFHSHISCVTDTGGGSDAPSWISMAKQKQKIYKENVKGHLNKKNYAGATRKKVVILRKKKL